MQTGNLNILCPFVLVLRLVKKSHSFGAGANSSF